MTRTTSTRCGCRGWPPSPASWPRWASRPMPCRCTTRPWPQPSRSPRTARCTSATATGSSSRRARAWKRHSRVSRMSSSSRRWRGLLEPPAEAKGKAKPEDKSKQTAGAKSRKRDQAVDLVLLIHPRELDKAAIRSLFADSVAAGARDPKLLRSIEEPLKSLRERNPDDLSVRIAAALTALAEGDSKQIRDALDALAKLTDRAPLEALPEAAHANTRQRTEAAPAGPALAGRPSLREARAVARVRRPLRRASGRGGPAPVRQSLDAGHAPRAGSVGARPGEHQGGRGRLVPDARADPGPQAGEEGSGRRSSARPGDGRDGAIRGRGGHGADGAATKAALRPEAGAARAPGRRVMPRPGAGNVLDPHRRSLRAGHAGRQAGRGQGPDRAVRPAPPRVAQGRASGRRHQQHPEHPADDRHAVRCRLERAARRGHAAGGVAARRAGRDLAGAGGHRPTKSTRRSATWPCPRVARPRSSSTPSRSRTPLCRTRAASARCWPPGRSRPARPTTCAAGSRRARASPWRSTPPPSFPPSSPIAGGEAEPANRRSRPSPSGSSATRSAPPPSWPPCRAAGPRRPETQAGRPRGARRLRQEPRRAPIPRSRSSRCCCSWPAAS